MQQVIASDDVPTGGRYLFVMLHAFGKTPASFDAAIEIIKSIYPDAEPYAPQLPFTYTSFKSLEDVAREQLTEIEARAGQFDHIFFIGHSTGAMLARKIWAIANGANEAGEFDTNRKVDWAEKIRRVVLLSPLNRGWTISSALSPFKRFVWTLGTGLGNLSRDLFNREPLIFQVRFGAPALTTTRLQCLATAKHVPTLHVQLLGTLDDIVAPTDSLDLATGQDFVYLEVEEEGHFSAVEMKPNAAMKSAASQFRLSISPNEAHLRSRSLHKEDVFDIYDVSVDDHNATKMPLPSTDVAHVVFVIHGIRDPGFWTRRIARKVKSRARKTAGKDCCRAVTSTYGYFPLGPFLLPWERRKKTEWLLDQYVSAKSLYPNAEFHYIGHSNGTYLLTNALKICPAVTFESAVLGGSVVRQRFQWSSVMPRQMKRVLNYVSTDDRVVAVFPHGLEMMGVQDMGGAGQYGFAQTPQNVVNHRSVVGGHSACLSSSRWDEMASFVIGGTLPTAPNPVPASSMATYMAGLFAPLIWLVLITIVIGIAGIFFYMMDQAAWVWAVALSVYLFLLRIVLTRA